VLTYTKNTKSSEIFEKFEIAVIFRQIVGDLCSIGEDLATRVVDPD
jgi:hypothetical protein